MLKNNICIRERHRVPTDKQELKKDMKLIQDFINKESKSSLILHLPQNIAQLTSELTELEISDNNYIELPQLLSLLGNLEKLLIHNNILKSLPNAIGKLLNLRIVNLSHNQLSELPDNLSDLKNLESLDLSFNDLESLPLSYAKLQRLRQLDISNNSFKSIPKCIANGMGTLRILNISQNSKVKINIIPYSKYLVKFYARENKNCCKFPDWILKHKFFNLKEFDLDKTQFDVLSFVGNEGHLCITSISMACSNLSSPILEMIIENMVCLEKINVGNENLCDPGNAFNNIPIHMLKKPEIITELNFRATGLSTIPVEIKLLYNLKKLDLGLNCISWFPEEFCELQKLEYLKMDGNGFIMFPENIGNLKSLQEIRAERNDILRLPISFKNLKNLRIVDMYNNMFEEFPNILFESNSLQGLDFEQNFCLTNDIMIGKISYSALRETYISTLQGHPEKISDLRCLGVKKQPSTISDDSGKISKEYWGSDEEEIENVSESIQSNTDENWDYVEDSDDEFKPDDIKEIHYVGNSQKFIPPEPNAFCPADLHSKRVKTEVASMRVYGSLPLYEIEQGQFDDA